MARSVWRMREGRERRSVGMAGGGREELRNGVRA